MDARRRRARVRRRRSRSRRPCTCSRRRRTSACATTAPASGCRSCRANATPEQVGYGEIADLTWQHLVSLDACTKCGKCHVACPATASGYPLSPRDLILDLRELAGARGASDGADRRADPAGDDLVVHAVHGLRRDLPGRDRARADHQPAAPAPRRARRARRDAAVDARGGLRDRQLVRRAASASAPRWTRELGFEVKDVRNEPAELLWFVGDYASFDARNQRATQALARILHDADVDFGILYDAEKTAGCDVRRAGEEGLWASLAEENVAAISGCDFERIFSSDPHTFHTLRNEYPQHGGEWTVLHHSQLLLELLDSSTIVPRHDARLPGHLPRPVHARPLQRRLRRAAARARGASAASSSRCRATATTRSAAAPAAGASG